MLDDAVKSQVREVFAGLKEEYTFEARIDDNHESKQELIDFLTDVASTSDKITCRIQKGEGLGFSLLKNGIPTGIKFRGIPNGHEFTSLLLAVLNSDGKGKNLPDEYIAGRIKAIKGTVALRTYVSLTCTNCPDVVQSLNIMALLNPAISHEMVDGAMNQVEAGRLNIQAVPTVYAGDEILHVGKGELGELLAALENKYGTTGTSSDTVTKEYDVVVVGAGPAGAAAAIYSARKGLKVCVLAEKTGGQVKETVGIENLISTLRVTGEELAANLKAHMLDYPVDLLEHHTVEKVELLADNYKEITVKGGRKFLSPILIIATGANWRKLNVNGESAYKGRGVAYCPHCDGPFYKDRPVAVIGGGNSGIEAAIDLSGICSKVTVFEFLDDLKADQLLQEKARSLPNVEIFVSSQTQEIIGDGNKVTSLRVKDRITEEERTVDLDGVFVQIGLIPNSLHFKDVVKTNRMGEIEIDTHCRTDVPGIYAAGDVTTVPYKQIVIAIGEGAKAALTAFEDRIRGLIPLR